MEDIVPERAMTALPSNLISQPTDKVLARVLALTSVSANVDARKKLERFTYILHCAPDVSFSSSPCYMN